MSSFEGFSIEIRSLQSPASDGDHGQGQFLRLHATFLIIWTSEDGLGLIEKQTDLLDFKAASWIGLNRRELRIWGDRLAYGHAQAWASV
jgi:hypothetical protein